MKKRILLLIICIISFSCDFVSSIPFKNKTDHTIYVVAYYKDRDGKTDYNSVKIDTNDVGNPIFLMNRHIEDLFSNNRNENPYFLIFHIDTVQKYSNHSYKSLENEHLYEAKLVFTKDEMENNDWKIIYE
ncbi:MAG: hypothetical protein LBO06_08635 [Bacteroidales bacterium]|jgi:hypothetical protein|nr:hypothetical protein [Bacteroidales bacterium]